MEPRFCCVVRVDRAGDSDRLELTDLRCSSLTAGPPPLIKAMVGHLTELGYDEPRKGISQPEDVSATTRKTGSNRTAS